MQLRPEHPPHPFIGLTRRTLASPRALKPVTYSIMHFLVAVGVAYALTRDWRIALGVGIIEPLVQTVAYTLHEAAWERRLKLAALRAPAGD